MGLKRTVKDEPLHITWYDYPIKPGLTLGKATKADLLECAKDLLKQKKVIDAERRFYEKLMEQT